MANLLSSTNSNLSKKDTNFQPVTPGEAASLRKNSKEMTETHYNFLFRYLYEHTGLPWRRAEDTPHPPGALVFQMGTPTLTHFQHRDRKYSVATAHDANSAIQFYDFAPAGNTVQTGTIEQIWQIPLQDQLRIFILAALDQSLSKEEEESLPFHQYPRFNTRVVDAEPSRRFVILEPAHIISHTVVYNRPAGTYGIDRATKVVCLSLNRGRY
jgi:hypothetical protein